jgi:hypothetical protein
MSREQIVRDTAYAIWEAEGKPQGRDREHWQQAEARVSASLTKGKAKPTPPAKGKVSADAAKAPPAAKPPAKAAATKAGPAKAVEPKKPKKTS